MCSFITQIAYGIMMLITLGLTAGGLFSENWVQAPDGSSKGILCGANSFTTLSKNTADFCPGWWDNIKVFERVTVVCLFLAIIFQILGLVWNFITICACCCKKHIIHPLSAISLLNVIALAIAVIVYAINSNTAINDIVAALGTVGQGSMGSSFIMECVALGMAILCTIVASLAICFAEKCV
ncbi:hypothetical protein PFISCL1PPCAC_22813 [Pristionchus fissidentatus]|uniref:Uncharacterized protein n=1 Tax=Pristionchus fissidentatus TaxID=1538716 RepID=A0AAV5WGX5_9BILA|nr:hypothetical protein PFISCL1PPCAC_22813 [Pristionchus fissidentatus]